MRNKIILAVFILSVLALKCHADNVLDIGTGARAIGMGKAFTAVTADANAFFCNPAGMNQIGSGEVVSMYGQLSSDVVYTILGTAFPFKSGTIGIGYAGNNTGDIPVTSLDANGRPVSVSTANYGSSVFMVGYADKLKDKLNYGINLKYLQQGSAAAGGTGSGMNLDIGMDYQVDNRLRMGAVLQNVLPGGLGTMKWSNGTTSDIPLVIKIGMAYKLRSNLDLYGDLDSETGIPIEAMMGAEWAVKDYFMLRCGLEQKSLSNSERYVNYSFGIGLKLASIRFDYAYYYDSLLSYNSRHFVSFSMQLPDFSKMRAVSPKRT